MRILLVEDHEDSGAALLKMLSHTSEVTWLKTADEALAEADKKPFDIIISDIGLGRGCGCAFMRSVRAGVTNKDTPSIALTANAEDGDKKASLEAGFNAHFVKPVNFDGLQAKILELSKS